LPAIDLGAAFAKVFGGAFAAVFAGPLAATLGAVFFSALRAETDGAAFARTGTDDFDFAAVFLSLEAALAMTCINPREEWEIARLTPFWTGRRKAAAPGIWPYTRGATT